MKNQWRAVWNRRTSSNDRLTGRWQDVLLELKRANGYDVMEGGLPLETFIGQDKQMRELLHLSPGKSVFEVGCGAGANLYLMQRDGIMVGGMDYSPPPRGHRTYGAPGCARAVLRRGGQAVDRADI